MKRVLKITAIIAAAVVGSIMLLVLLFIMLGGPADPIMLTAEEEIARQEEQFAIYKNVDLTGFSAKTIDDEQINSEIFQKYDVTMVNIWFTECSPCIEEMPEIAVLAEKLPFNFNVITVCADLIGKEGDIDNKTVKVAKEIMKQCGADIITLIPDKIIQEQLVSITTIFPTTIFISKNGTIIGDPYYGERSAEKYLLAMEELYEASTNQLQ